MNTPFLSFGQMSELFNVEHDWLFEKFLGKLNSHRHLILTADQHWGIQQYVEELGFQLEEKHRDIQICYIDVRLAQTSASFLDLFQTMLRQKFQEVVQVEEVPSGSVASLRLPSVIARKKRIRVGVFLSNVHLFHRFRDADSFLRIFRRYSINQKNCIFCLYGINTVHFRKLVHAPGPLSGLGQLFELRHDPAKHRSAGIRKLFHENNKRMGYQISILMSYIVDNHPFYLKLFAWHVLIRTRNQCTMKIMDVALNDLLLHFEPQFLKTVEKLTPRQLNYLHALVKEGSKLCSQKTMKAYQLGSSGHVSRIKQSLESKEIIDTGGHTTVFADPLFREWLKNRYFKSGSLLHPGSLHHRRRTPVISPM
ncbi:MAG: hypothetical protein P1P86_10910 [Bacteroidales bacterium]|nr:hypothetical protein [Bacteroidales bacterium]